MATVSAMRYLDFIFAENIYKAAFTVTPSFFAFFASLRETFSLSNEDQRDRRNTPGTLGGRRFDGKSRRADQKPLVRGHRLRTSRPFAAAPAGFSGSHLRRR